MTKLLSKEFMIEPTWTAPASVVAFSTTVEGGVSQTEYASLNLGLHVGDQQEHVHENRLILQKEIGNDIKLCWLNQVHSDRIVDVKQYVAVTDADAAVSSDTQRACVIMTADCLPVLLCNKRGTRVAALHCGWKGLHCHLINKVIGQYFRDDKVLAWLGPAIAKNSYEVNESLYQKFLMANSAYEKAFFPNAPGHYLMDLYAIAKEQLVASGIKKDDIFGGEYNTFDDPRFFSYRRNSQTGRMASVIYLR